MSDTKISALPDGGAVQSTDEFVAARAGTNVKIAGSALGSGSLLWAAFDSVGDSTITSGNVGILGFTTGRYGAGTLTSVTTGPYPDGGDPSIFLPEVGAYLVSFVALPSGPSGGFSSVVDPAQLEIECQVFNGENDPFLVLPVYRPADPYAYAANSFVLNVYEIDSADPVDPARGFSVIVRARSTDFTPMDGFITLKIVQLATT